MTDEGYFTRESLADQIALYAIYMPVLRSEVQSFVQTWNVHRIRKQRQRPTVVHGKPYMNYHYPPDGVEDHGIPVNAEAFYNLESAVQDWGKYSCLLIT